MQRTCSHLIIGIVVDLHICFFVYTQCKCAVFLPWKTKTFSALPQYMIQKSSFNINSRSNAQVNHLVQCTLDALSSVLRGCIICYGPHKFVQGSIT